MNLKLKKRCVYCAKYFIANNIKDSLCKNCKFKNKMGNVDTVDIRCHKCLKNTISQTKILGECDLINFKIGSKIMFNDLSDCILKLKDKCPFCNSYNAIKIRDRIIVGVENPNKADCIEKPFGEYKMDELKNILNLKLEKENGKKR